MSLFKNNKDGGILNVIRCDEPSYLIWKWHPKESESGESRRENSIRLGSSLRVKDGSVAVFVYNKGEDFIEGPTDSIIKTLNLPILSGIIGLAYNGDTPFQAEVYFINLAEVIQTKFFVPFFDLYDPRFEDFSVPVAVRGTITFKISDYRRFVKIHRLDQFDIEDLKKQISDAVSVIVKGVVANMPQKAGIPAIQIERQLLEINAEVNEQLSYRLMDVHGIYSTVDVGVIDIDKTSEGYSKLMSVTQEVTSKTVQAETQAKIKTIHDMQQINMENASEVNRIQREEDQYARHLATQSGNIEAYRVTKQSEVGVAAAEALGKMGANGAVNMNLPDGGTSGGTGFNPVGMMTGMAIGGAIGRNMAGMMNNVLGEIQNSGIQTPPSIPASGYHVAINNQPAGPYDLIVLGQMVSAGTLTEDSLVWKPGMLDWQRADTIVDLQQIFGKNVSNITPPPIPTK